MSPTVMQNHMDILDTLPFLSVTSHLVRTQAPIMRHRFTELINAIMHA